MGKIGFGLGILSTIVGVLLLLFGNDSGLLLILLGVLTSIANKEM